jgi:hypothetical protein
LYNPKKTPEPNDAQSAYEDSAVRGGWGHGTRKDREAITATSRTTRVPCISAGQSRRLKYRLVC